MALEDKLDPMNLLVPPVITKEDLEELEQFKRDIGYFDRNYQEMKASFPDQWVAILNERLIGHDAEYERLIKTLKDEGYDIGKPHIAFLPTKEIPWIFQQVIGTAHYTYT